MSIFSYHFLRLLFSIIPFFIHNRFSVSVPIVRAFFQSLQVHEASNIPLGVAGYCWGGKHATILASGEAQQNGWPLVDSIFVGHPGGLEIPQDIDKIKVPYSVAIGDRDFVLKQSDVSKIVEALNKRKDIPTEVKIYPGARHGFALRGNPGDKREKLQGEAAMRQAVEWLLESLCKAEKFAGVGKGIL